MIGQQAKRILTREQTERTVIHEKINLTKLRARSPTRESLIYRKIAKRFAEEASNILKKNKIYPKCGIITGSTPRGTAEHNAKKTSDIDFFFVLNSTEEKEPAKGLLKGTVKKYNRRISGNPDERNNFIKPIFWTPDELKNPFRASIFLSGKSNYGKKQYDALKKEVFRKMETDADFREKVMYFVNDFPEFMRQTRKNLPK